MLRAAHLLLERDDARHRLPRGIGLAEVALRETEVREVLERRRVLGAQHAFGHRYRALKLGQRELVLLAGQIDEPDLIDDLGVLAMLGTECALGDPERTLEV